MGSENLKPTGVFNPMSNEYFKSLPMIMQETIMQSMDSIENEEDMRVIASGLLNFNENGNIVK